MFITKKVNIMLLALMLILGVVAPAGADTVAPGNTTATKQVKNLSLEEALQLAEQNCYSVKMLKSALDVAVIRADQGEHIYENLKDIQDSPMGYTVSTYDGVGGAFVNKEAAEIGKQIAQKDYDVGLEQIMLKIKSKYYAVLEAQDTVKVKEAALARSQKQLDIANASFKVGSAAKTDVLQAEAALAQAKSELTNARNQYKLAVISLNADLGLDLDTPLQLTTKVNKQNVIGDLNLQQFIDEAFKSRIDMARDEGELKKAQITRDKLMVYKGGKSFDSKLARISLENTKLKLEETKKGVVFDVTKAYLNVQAAEEGLQSIEKAVEQARESMRLTELRYQVGLGTSLEVLNASVYLNELESNAVKALYHYNLAKMTFETAKLAPPPSF